MVVCGPPQKAVPTEAKTARVEMQIQFAGATSGASRRS